MLIVDKINRLTEYLQTFAPIVGVRHVQGTEVVIDFHPSATQQQITAANTALASFDWSDAADDLWAANSRPNRKDLRDQAEAAINRLDQIINAPTPTMSNLTQVVTALTNQILPAIRDMARYEKAIIKRLIEID